MEHNQKIEVFSNLRKIAHVQAIDDKIIPGSLVFESRNPFPGYYHETPDSPAPVYLYLVLDMHYPLEEIVRATQEIEGDFDWHFDAGKGVLNIIDETYYVIRLRHFGNYNLVKDIQQAYLDQGLGFLMKHKRPGKYTGYLKIVKFLYLEEIGKGIYLDLKEKNHGYIEIPKFVDWSDMQDITKQVSYNWTGSEFDAAYGSFYHNRKLHEFVRIYSNKLSSNYLEEIRKLYIDKIK